MNTQKTLLAILVEDLPNRGGWPEGAVCATQDEDGEVFFSEGATPEFGLSAWHDGDWCGNEFYTITAIDYATAIITRDQYEAALAASKAVVSHNGWIDWHGGECPVDSDAIVEVRFRNQNQNHYQYNNDRAGDFEWEHIGSNCDIIAYRIVNPHEAQPAGIVLPRDTAILSDEQSESDLNDCIGQPQSSDDARDEILYELANFAATTKTSLDIGVATEIAIWLSGKGYRKQ